MFSVTKLTLSDCQQWLCLPDGRSVCAVGDAMSPDYCSWAETYYPAWSELFPEFVAQCLEDGGYSEPDAIPELGIETISQLKQGSSGFKRVRPGRCHCGSWFIGEVARKSCSDACQHVRQTEQRREWDKRRTRYKADRFQSCVACGQEFEASRSTAKYCSASCKQAAYRARLPHFGAMV
jgi:hypothetical protein